MNSNGYDLGPVSTLFAFLNRTGISIATLFVFVACAAISSADDKEQKINKWKSDYEEKILPIIKEKCLSCHTGEKSEGEFNFDKFSDGNAAFEGNDVWERVARRVRLNEMPPKDSPGLNDPQKGDFHRWVDSRPNQDLCKQLASDETQSWYRGFVMSRRLTKSEYSNSIRDMTGFEVPAGHEPPSDGAGGEGFDTVGDALFTSTIHLETYLSIADELIDLLLRENPEGLNEQQQKIRNQILLGDPKDESVDRAKKSISSFAKRAWRRPVSQNEVDRLATIFEQMRSKGKSYLLSIREPIKAILVSPNFLFVVDAEPKESGVQRLSPHQLAMRLSLFIWSSIPDDELLAAADSGLIYDEIEFRKQISRMLQDTKASAIGENFGLQWLGLRGFGEIKPDHEIFPEYDAELAKAMRYETVTFLTNIFRENRSINELIDSNYTYLNGRLAKHYEIEADPQMPWQKYEWKDKRRGGIITMASVLTTASYPRRTSPVLRGRWILEEVLGAAVPPPPPNVPALDESVAADNVKTLRQRLELHRTKSECASCHDRMDPLGFGLENFDGIGRWRDSDHGQPIDSQGTLPGGAKFNGPEELKKVILSRQGEFQRHFVRKLLGFALGRELNKFDGCIVDECLKKLKENEYRASIVIEEIALSYPFQYRYFKRSPNTAE